MPTHGTDHHQKGTRTRNINHCCSTGEPQSSSADTRCVRFLNSVQSPDCYTSTKVSKAPGQRDVPSLSCRHSFGGKQGLKRHSWDRVVCVLRTEQTLRVCKELSPALPGNVEKAGPEKGCVSSDLKSEDSPWRYGGLKTRAPPSRGDIRTKATTKTVAGHRLQHSLRQIRQHLFCSPSLCETGRPHILSIL